MSDRPVLGLPVAGGFFRGLASRLRVRSRDVAEPLSDFPPESDRSTARSCGSVRLLVVDDNPVNLMVMSALMASRGLVPVLAADGAEAVALACEIPFDLILMDLQMPILDGWEATAAIRRFEQSGSRPQVPVLAYSSLSPGAGALALHGMNGSLDKPCDLQALDDCLVQWCPGFDRPPRPDRAMKRGFGDEFRSKAI